MFEYPNILANPFDEVFGFDDLEIYSLKECDELLKLERYSFSLFALWTASIVNIQRRIEKFGIDVLLKIKDEQDGFDKNAETLTNRWAKVEEQKVLKYTKKLNLISPIAFSLLTTLFSMKSQSTEFQIDKQEVLCMVYLLEKNLFLTEFKEDQRGKNPSIVNTKMKFRRKEDIKTDINQIPKTHHELLLRSGVKIFEEQNKTLSEEKNILDEYC